MAHNHINNVDNFEGLIPPFEHGGINLGIERIKKALQSIGNPCKNIPAIQVVGTNGKGSIVSFIESCLQNSEINIGVTTSPHLIEWNERIRSNGKSITTNELKCRLKKLLKIESTKTLTPFELIITTALDFFEYKKVDLLILEVGLGGRLDATTAHNLRPIIAMGSIGLDHCNILGKELEQIALEKAAVITHKSTVISCTQHPAVEKILKKTADMKKARIHWVKPIPKKWKLGIPGEIQRENAAVAKGAIEALKEFGWEINEEQIRKGFSIANWPGRLQPAKWEERPLLVDGAHNPPAARELSKERELWAEQEKGINWILGIQRNKDAPLILKNLVKRLDFVWIIPIPGHKSWTKEELIKECPELETHIKEEENIQNVFLKLISNNKWPKPCPVISGSLYLIGSLFKEKTISKR